MAHCRLPYISSISDNHSQYPQRALTPTFQFIMGTPPPSHSWRSLGCSRLYVENPARHPTSPFVPYREFQVPDIYVDRGPLRRKFSYPPDCVSRKRRTHSYVFDAADPRARADYDEPRSCLAELRANHLLNNHAPVGAATGCTAGHYPGTSKVATPV
ncbi:hypothetical protein KUCAC02_008361 [Chaenocephalus aceratus]|uniref:Uncharacterized protein n=1 Tax=Chaenocephalus aceratus TaxID=36190 RepID=A0ACB9X9L4_CHAAC|nr:hypothetical protein KUCAC02_008361 [Chaenocephalus aceratus]